MTTTENKQDVKDFVRESYGRTAQKGGGCCGADKGAEDFAERLGYTKEELGAVPEGANMALSCGNPVALASLREGEVVVDLGSGGGFDCFIAGTKVGATGRVIGVDMTPDMLGKARRGIAKYRERTGLDNVEFRMGEIEHLPVADASVDVVISNCVLNLSADKEQVWREIGRVLKPGGRVAISDIAIMQPLPEAIRADLRMLSACVSGAVPVAEMEGMVREAGLEDVRIEPKAEAADVWESYTDPIVNEVRQLLPEGTKMSDYAASVNVSAVKGEGGACCDAAAKKEAEAEAGAESGDAAVEAGSATARVAVKVPSCC